MIIRTVPSTSNKADLGTKVLPEARQRSLRAVCGTTMPSEPRTEPLDSGDEERDSVGGETCHAVARGHAGGRSLHENKN